MKARTKEPSASQLAREFGNAFNEWKYRRAIKDQKFNREQFKHRKAR